MWANEDCPSFYNETCFKLIDEWEPDFSISVGDYNVTLDPNLDKKKTICMTIIL